MAVVQVITSLSSKEPTIMHLLRALLFYMALFNIQIRAEHIPGIQNIVADSISRNQMQVFREAAPHAVCQRQSHRHLRFSSRWTTMPGHCPPGRGCCGPRQRQSSKELTEVIQCSSKCLYPVLPSTPTTSIAYDRTGPNPVRSRLITKSVLFYS